MLEHAQWFALDYSHKLLHAVVVDPTALAGAANQTVHTPATGGAGQVLGANASAEVQPPAAFAAETGAPAPQHPQTLPLVTDPAAPAAEAALQSQLSQGAVYVPSQSSVDGIEATPPGARDGVRYAPYTR